MMLNALCNVVGSIEDVVMKHQPSISMFLLIKWIHMKDI